MGMFVQNVHSVLCIALRYGATCGGNYTVERARRGRSSSSDANSGIFFFIMIRIRLPLIVKNTNKHCQW